MQFARSHLLTVLLLSGLLALACGGGESADTPEATSTAVPEATVQATPEISTPAADASEATSTPAPTATQEATPGSPSPSVDMPDFEATATASPEATGENQDVQKAVASFLVHEDIASVFETTAAEFTRSDRPSFSRTPNATNVFCLPSTDTPAPTLLVAKNPSFDLTGEMPEAYNQAVHIYGSAEESSTRLDEYKRALEECDQHNDGTLEAIEASGPDEHDFTSYAFRDPFDDGQTAHNYHIWVQIEEKLINIVYVTLLDNGMQPDDAAAIEALERLTELAVAKHKAFYS